MEKLCGLLKGDFMHVPVEDGTFDAVFEIEATCHAPSKEGVYAEMFRILKPGGTLLFSLNFSSMLCRL